MKDVLDTELQLFLRSILPDEDAVQTELRDYADAHHISVVDPEVGYLLHLLTGLVQPNNVLEIGTAIGIYIARAIKEGRLTTIELQEERHVMALEYFKRAGVAEKIHAICGDARELVPQLDEQYDMIFMDAAKGQYIHFMPDTGSMMAMFERSTGRLPDIIMGKPYAYTVDYVTNRIGCKREEIAFVGDRLETDIAIGTKNGLKAVLVYTGVTTPEMYEKSEIKATVTFENIGELGKALI